MWKNMAGITYKDRVSDLTTQKYSKGSSINHVVKILGIFDPPPPPFVVTFSK